jgi:hypothetical protein
MLLQMTGFHLLAEQCSVLYMYHIFFIHSPVDQDLGCLHFLAIENRTEMKLGRQMSHQYIDAFLFDIY